MRSQRLKDYALKGILTGVCALLFVGCQRSERCDSTDVCQSDPRGMRGPFSALTPSSLRTSPGHLITSSFICYLLCQSDVGNEWRIRQCSFLSKNKKQCLCDVKVSRWKLHNAWCIVWHLKNLKPQIANPFSRLIDVFILQEWRQKLPQNWLWTQLWPILPNWWKSCTNSTSSAGLSDNERVDQWRKKLPFPTHGSWQIFAALPSFHWSGLQGIQIGLDLWETLWQSPILHWIPKEIFASMEQVKIVDGIKEWMETYSIPYVPFDYQP